MQCNLPVLSSSNTVLFLSGKITDESKESRNITNLSLFSITLSDTTRIS